MTLRDSGTIRDLLFSAKTAVSYLEGCSRAEFEDDLKTQDATIRRLEIIGEAAKRLGERIDAELPELPWRKMRDMRNLMIHRYWEIDLDIVWSTVRDDLPGVIDALERYLA